MSILDQAKQQGRMDCVPQKTYEPQKPSMSAKLNRVAELFELDVLSEEEALKACKVIIGQHAKVIPNIGAADGGSKPPNPIK